MTGTLRRGACAAVGAWLLIASGLDHFQTSARAANSPAATGPRESISIRWNATDAARASVEVTGLSPSTLEKLRVADWQPAQWQRLFPVYAGQGDVIADLSMPPMLGSYSIQSGALHFEPQFPLEPRVKYRALFRPDELPGATAGARAVTALFQLPAPPSTPTTVVSVVYPTAEVLPENLLKFYLHFSAPMRRGHIYEHLHLIDDKGKEVDLPFLEIGEELWDNSMTRLTLFIDPGRIKRGVKPLEEIGPSLQAGKKFTFVIDREWEDATGNPLKESFRRNFQVGPPDREPMDQRQWKIQAPKAGTSDPLHLAFPKPVDHALGLRVIQITNEAGDRMDGQPGLRDAERLWTFVPEQPWRPGRYRIVVQNTFEDLAGNNVGKPFEVDLFNGIQRRITNTFTTLPFEVR